MKKYIDIICILDRSGSMSSIINDAIGGYNSFLKEQQGIDGDARVTNILFDSKYEVINNCIDIHEIEPFTTKTYTTRGTTALYDAIGRTIDERVELMSQIPLEERPEKTLCVILTDGEENASRKFSSKVVKEMITEMREDFKWEFIFLSANQDSFAAADAIGVSRSNTMSWNSDSAGTKLAYASMSRATKSYRTSSKTEDLFDEEK